MSERPKFFNNPLSCRFSNEEYLLREEQFSEMFPDLEPEGLTNRVVVNSLFDRAFGIFKRENQPRKQDKETIEQLNNEIGRLKMVIDAKDGFYTEQSEVLLQEKRKCLNLQDAINNQQAGTVIAADQLLITVPPIIAKVIEIEAATAKRKTGKPYSSEDILMQSFWNSVKVGCAYPWRTWSNSELSQIANDLKAAE